ncbi:hypothetical protein SDC9_82168 [bioreactor metagenome]|uniref:Uncharacterized protein n=1 Tax=bioreactor metagenome TaxID=1076179 RepID=A0A644Z3U7_9ZZZZ
MIFDVETLVITKSVINLFCLVIIWVSVKLNENIRGSKLWVWGNACNCSGILLLLMRKFISNQSIGLIIGSELTVLGSLFIYIGVMRFLERKINYKIIASSYVAFTILNIYFTYIKNNSIFRASIFSFYLAVYLIIASVILLKNKDYSIKKATNFLGVVILSEGFIFLVIGITKIISTFSSKSFEPSSLSVIIHFMFFMWSLFITFGLILMVNLKLNSEIKIANKTLQLIFDTTPDAFFITSLQSGTIEKANDIFYMLTGFPKEEVIGKTAISLGLWNNPKERQRFIKELKENLQLDNFEMDIRKKGNTIITVLISAKVMNINGEEYVINVARDISERKKAEELLKSSEKRYRDLAEDIKYLSYHDQLTGLYNRRFYEEELKRLDTERNLPLTLIMADVNGLKLTNDAFGHLAGDKLIKEIAEIFKNNFRQDEIIARIGGDEFIILLPQIDTKEAQEIMSRVNESFRNKQLDNMILSVSFGLATKYEVNKEITEIYIEAEDQMYRTKLIESNNMKNKTIELITRTFNEKNEVEKHHAERVSELCKNTATILGLSKDEVQKFKTAGLLHDIGKTGIDEKILSKQGKLDANEWLQIKRNPEIGYQLLKSSNEFSHISELVLAHHERWDGKGYPKGLKGEEIPFESRVIAIADAYDAMTNARSYRSPLTSKAAIEELQKNAGTQFDAELVNIFVNKVIKDNL